MLSAVRAQAVLCVPALLVGLALAAHAQEGKLSPPDALHQAVRTNRLEEATKLLDAGVDVNARDTLGSTPLLDAAWNGNLAMVRLLLEHHADVNAKHAEAGSTALEYAVLTGHPEIARLLLCAHADVRTRYRTEQTILHIAAGRGQTELLGDLLEAGADLGAADANRNTPLDEAVLHDRLPAVRFLLAHGALNAGQAHGSVDGRGPLHEAALKGYADLVPALLAAGCQAGARDASGQTALDLALAYKNPAAVKALLEAGGDLQSSREAAARAMESATMRGQTEIVQLLIGSGFNVNDPTATGSTYLHDAALKGRIRVATLLLDKDARLDARNSSGGTPLHDAALGGSAPMIELLLHRGAAIDARDTESEATPLMLAATLGRREALTALLRGGANVELRDRSGLTALDRARKADETEIVQVLVDAAAAARRK